MPIPNSNTVTRHTAQSVPRLQDRLEAMLTPDWEVDEDERVLDVRPPVGHSQGSLTSQAGALNGIISQLAVLGWTAALIDPTSDTPFYQIVVRHPDPVDPET